MVINKYLDQYSYIRRIDNINYFIINSYVDNYLDIDFKKNINEKLWKIIECIEFSDI